MGPVGRRRVRSGVEWGPFRVAARPVAAAHTEPTESAQSHEDMRLQGREKGKIRTVGQIQENLPPETRRRPTGPTGSPDRDGARPGALKGG